MSVSTIPSFRAALLTRLQADAGLAGVQITIGHPHPAQPAGELVMIRDTVDGSSNAAGLYGAGQSSVSLGQRSREERYVTEVVCSVITNHMNNQQTIEERVMAIAGVVETSIRDWSSNAGGPWTGISLPSGARFGWVIVNSVALTQHMSDIAREARATIHLATSARI